MSIAWDDLTRDAKAHGTSALAKVAESWNFRSKQEHLAVGAFSTIANELASEGCEPIVLSLVTRAANDEVRHVIEEDVLDANEDAIDGEQ